MITAEKAAETFVSVTRLRKGYFLVYRILVIAILISFIFSRERTTTVLLSLVILLGALIYLAALVFENFIKMGVLGDMFGKMALKEGNSWVSKQDKDIRLEFGKGEMRLLNGNNELDKMRSDILEEKSIGQFLEKSLNLFKTQKNLKK